MCVVNVQGTALSSLDTIEGRTCTRGFSHLRPFNGCNICCTQRLQIRCTNAGVSTAIFSDKVVSKHDIMMTVESFNAICNEIFNY